MQCNIKLPKIVQMVLLINGCAWLSITSLIYHLLLFWSCFRTVKSWNVESNVACSWENDDDHEEEEDNEVLTEPMGIFLASPLWTRDNKTPNHQLNLSSILLKHNNTTEWMEMMVTTVEYYWRTVYVGEYVLRTGAWGPPYPEPEKIFKILLNVKWWRLLLGASGLASGRRHFFLWSSSWVGRWTFL